MAQRLEKDKMLAGEIYNRLDLALVAEREQAKLLLRQYNQNSDPAMQREIWQKLLGQLGEGSIIEPPFFCSYGRNLYLDNRVYLNFCCTILDNNSVIIEDNVWIRGGAIILPGVTLGQNAVAGAGAMVTRDVPANTVVVGNPAHIIKTLEA